MCLDLTRIRNENKPGTVFDKSINMFNLNHDYGTDIVKQAKEYIKKECEEYNTDSRRIVPNIWYLRYICKQIKAGKIS